MLLLDQVRQQYPAYNDWSDADLLGGLRAKFYADLSNEEFNSQVDARERELRAEADGGAGGEFAAGVYGMGANLARAGQATAQAVGADRVAGYLAETAEGAQRAAQEADPVSSPLLDSKTVGDVATGVREVLAKNAPQIVATLGAGVAGTLAAGPLGGLVAGFAVNYPLMFGQNAQEQLDQKGEIESPGKAAAWAVPGAALDAAINLLIPGGGKAAGGMVTRFVKGGAAGTLTEAPTEFTQEVLTIYQAGGDPTDPKNRQRLLEAAIAGALLGGVAGGGLSFLEKGSGHENDQGFIDPATISRAERDNALVDLAYDKDTKRLLAANGIDVEAIRKGDVSALQSDAATKFLARIIERRNQERAKSAVAPTPPATDGSIKAQDAELLRQRALQAEIDAGRADPGAAPAPLERAPLPDTFVTEAPHVQARRDLDQRLSDLDAREAEGPLSMADRRSRAILREQRSRMGPVPPVSDQPTGSEELRQAMALRGTPNLPAVVGDQPTRMTPDEIRRAQARNDATRGAPKPSVREPELADSIRKLDNAAAGLEREIARRGDKGPTARQQRRAEDLRAERERVAAELNQLQSWQVITVPPGRAGQTVDDRVQDRRAREAFDLADRQRARTGADPDTRDTRAAGRPDGGVDSQRTVYLDEGNPVRIVSKRSETREDGSAVTIATVEPYDPRTGESLREPYDVKLNSLKTGKYAQNPRAAQEFEDAARAPIIPGVGRADEMQGLPRQTFRTTDEDPGNPVGPDGPVSPPRADRPQQGEGPRQDAGGGTRGPSTAEGIWRAYQDYMREEAEARARGERTEGAERTERAGERYAGKTATGQPKGKDRDGEWVVDEDGYVVSKGGAPITFASPKDAAKWAQKHQTDRSQYTVDIHPTATRSTGRGGSEALHTVRRTARPQAEEKAAPEQEAPAAGRKRGADTRSEQPEFNAATGADPRTGAQPQRQIAGATAKPAAEPAAAEPAAAEPAAEPTKAAEPDTGPDVAAVMAAAAGDYDKLNAVQQALFGKVGLAALTGAERQQVLDVLAKDAKAAEPTPEPEPEPEPEPGARAAAPAPVTKPYGAVWAGAAPLESDVAFVVKNLKRVDIGQVGFSLIRKFAYYSIFRPLGIGFPIKGEAFDRDEKRANGADASRILVTAEPVPIVQLAQLELAPATPSAKLAALKEAYAATPGTQPGRYEFRDPAGQGDGRGASITKSAKSAGFQLSMFDGNGFSGDMQFDTMDDALTSAMSSGFIEPAPGHLADMAQLESFQEGNARTLAMEKGPAPRAAAPTPDPVAEAPVAEAPAAPTPAEPLSDDPVQRARDRAAADGGLAVVPANEILDDINENPTGEDWKAARDRTLRDMDGLISFAESWTQERDANLPFEDRAGNYNPRNYPGGMAAIKATVEATNAKRDEMLAPVFISYTLRTASGRTTKMRIPLDPVKLAGIKKNLSASRNYIFESKGDATPKSKDALRESYQELDEQGKVTKTVDVPTPGARRVNSGQIINLSAREKFEQRPFDYQAADGTRYVYTEDAAARIDEIEALVQETLGESNPNAEVRVVSQIYDGTGKPVLGASTDLGDGRLVVAALSYVDPATGETLANPNLQGTLRHETVHDLRARGMFTPQEDKLLFRSARNRRIRDDLDITKDYGDKPDAVQAEEAIARAAEIPGKYASDPKLNSLLDRIRRFFQRLGNKLRGMGFQTFEDVFDKFESGEIGRRPDNSFPSQSSAFTTTQTRTTGFKNWFRGSKVVDENGDPLVVYHGTSAGGFDVFKAARKVANQLGFGIHFAEDETLAGGYADGTYSKGRGKRPQVYKAYLAVRNPLYADRIVDEGTPEFDLAKRLAGSRFFPQKNENGVRQAYIQNAIDSTSGARAEKLIRAAGYDGVVYKAKLVNPQPGGYTSGGGGTAYVVFEPTQIKSATDNNGDFDPNNPSILEQRLADSVPETVTLFQAAPYRSEAAATNPAENPVFKPGVWAKLFGNPREDVRAIAETLMSGVSALAASNARRPLYKKLTDITKVIGYANRGVLKRVVSELQSNGNTAGAEYVQGLLDKLATDPGSGDAKAETLEAATESQFRRSRKRLLDALGGVEGATNTENMDAVSAALAGVRAAPAHLRDTVAAVRRILDERHDYLTKAGIDVGYVRGKFFPRMLDRDAIVANPSAFLEAATKAFQTAGVPLADARTAADEWYSASTINQSMDIGGVGPGTNITKGRSLVSPQVDRIMRDFYVTDPTEALQSYLLQAARRAEYARRFHDENGKDLARELPAILQRLGVDPDLQSLTVRAFESSTGRLARGAGGPLYSAASWLQTVGTISLLPRALLSSIAEPATIGVRTGDVRDSLRAFSGTLGDLIDVAKGNPSEERRLGEALGIIGDALSDSFLQARFGGAVESKVQRKLTAKFFRATGLQPWTEANRVAAIRIGRGFIKSILDDHAAGVASSERMLAEFGIAKADIPAFKTWMDSVDGMPSEADFTEESAGSEMYRVALGRFVRETVMEPESVDRPVFANHPIGRMMYGLTSFLYGFGRQVMLRTGKQLADALDPRTGLSTAERVSLAQPVVALVGLVAVHALVSDLREELFNRRKNDERTSGEKLEIALSRSGIFGPADPLYNAIRGLKYQRDLSNIVIGPGPGVFLQSIGDILAITQANSERTNTSERNAAMGAYSLLAVPAISASLGLLPAGMGMVPQALFTAGVMYGTSPGAKQRFADIAVGPKQSAGGASARGSGRGSGRG